MAALASGAKAPDLKVPTAFTVFPQELFKAPKSWAEKVYPNLTYFEEAPKGGHFAAWEEPRSSPRSCATRSDRCADVERDLGRRGRTVGAGPFPPSIGGVMSHVTEIPGRPTVVLVHGALADGSSWNGVVERL